MRWAKRAPASVSLSLTPLLDPLSTHCASEHPRMGPLCPVTQHGEWLAGGAVTLPAPRGPGTVLRILLQDGP